MKVFKLTLPNEKTRTYGYVTLFVLLINFLVFGFIFYNTVDVKVKSTSLLGTLLSLFFLAMFIIRHYSKKFSTFRVEISFIILSILWIIPGKYLLACCMFCFAIFGFYTRRKFEVLFSTENIVYPSFPKKTFLWKDVSNVILKDGMLTIDLKNNTLIQSVIEKDNAAVIDESLFNAFCREQLKGSEKSIAQP